MSSEGHRLNSAIAQIAEMAASGLAVSKMGLVTSYDPATFSAKVVIQPSGIESGFLPICPPWAGNGWGFFAPPPTGAQVLVLFQEADSLVGVITLTVPNDIDVPLAVPLGQAWWQDSAGSFVKLTNDGQITVTAPNGLTIDANVTVNGWVHSTGDVIANGKSLDSHTHPDPQGGNTGPPN
jgi:phage baseplate assembly protein gpV